MARHGLLCFTHFSDAGRARRTSMHRHCPDQPAGMLEQAVTTYASLQLFRTMVVTAPLGETVASFSL